MNIRAKWVKGKDRIKNVTIFFLTFW